MLIGCAIYSKLRLRRSQQAGEIVSEKYHVYLLIDPLIESEHWQNRVFYVGKGTGSRALHHELESGESKKLARIRQIRKMGDNYQVLYATWTNRASNDPILMSERDAFRLEAAFIEALRPQLTNKASGHGLTFESSSTLDRLEGARLVTIPSEINALVVSVKGIRGGTDPIGMFVAPKPEHAWENIRRWWDFGKKTQEQLRSLLDENEPVALIAVTSSNRGHPNIVVEVYQIADFSLEPDPINKRPKVVFERKGANDVAPLVTSLRDNLRGNTLCIDGKPMILRQRRMSVHDRQAAGYSPFAKKLGPNFAK